MLPGVHSPSKAKVVTNTWKGQWASRKPLVPSLPTREMGQEGPSFHPLYPLAAKRERFAGLWEPQPRWHQQHEAG